LAHIRSAVLEISAENPFFVPGDLTFDLQPSEGSNMSSVHVNLLQISSAIPEISTGNPVFIPPW